MVIIQNAYTSLKHDIECQLKAHTSMNIISNIIYQTVNNNRKLSYYMHIKVNKIRTTNESI